MGVRGTPMNGMSWLEGVEESRPVVLTYRFVQTRPRSWLR